MRISAQAPRFLILILLVALMATLGGLGCGKKSDDQAKSGPGSMPGMSGSNMMGGPGGSGMPGGGMMPGTPGGGGMPGAPGGGMMAGGGATAGAPTAAPVAAPVSVEPQKSPSAPAVTPAPAPSAQQTAVVGEAVWTLRLMTSRNVPPPPPGKEPKPKAKPAPGSSSAPGGMGGAMPGMGGGAPGGGMMPGGPGGAMPGAPGGGMMPGAPGGAMPGPGMMGPKAARPFNAKDYRFAQGSPKGGPDGKGAKGIPGDKGGKGGPGGDAPAAASSTPTPMAIAQAIKTVCQKTRGIEMNGQKFYHEYWFMLSKSLLDEVVTKYSDFPVAQLSWAAQTKSDWEGYMWHWAVRKMLTQSSNSDLQDVAKFTAKARIALATVRAISKHGMLMKGVNQTRMGKLLYPTMDHVANCVQFAFGNPNYDPASIKRDESKRSRLVVEVFDNYLKTGGNWRWYRSRDWAYLSRYSSTVPAYTCDSCGTTLKPEQMKQLYRCPTCGKSMRPNIPGTWDTVEPYKTAAGRTDDYRVAGMRNPMDDRMPDGKYSIRKSWYSPTFQRQREAYRNAQRVHELVNMVMASNMPTRADFDAMKAWAASSPKPTKIPEIHQMELEANEVRLRETARIR